MVLAHARRFAWTHHQFCAFDWKWIDQFHPDEVWWMPTERYIVCPPGFIPRTCRLWVWASGEAAIERARSWLAIVPGDAGGCRHGR